MCLICALLRIFQSVPSRHFGQHVLEKADRSGEITKEQTLPKYGVENSGNTVDLMAITQDPRICIWNILRYSLRMWNGKMKKHDLEKVAHYAELAWTLSDGRIVESNGAETQSLKG